MTYTYEITVESISEQNIKFLVTQIGSDLDFTIEIERKKSRYKNISALELRTSTEILEELRGVLKEKLKGETWDMTYSSRHMLEDLLILNVAFDMVNGANICLSDTLSMYLKETKDENQKRILGLNCNYWKI